jgi:nicotinamidase-related amidase
MKRSIRISLWLAALLLVPVAILVGLFYMAMQPTVGPAIPAYPNPRAALLVIDIQEDYTGPAAREPYREGDRIVAFSNALIGEAARRGIDVVFIKNVIDAPVISLLAGGINAPGAPGTGMDRRLRRVAGVREFTKNRSDAFSNGALDGYLRERQVATLYLVGLDGAYCVNATALGALNRHYRVVMLPEGIATESRQPMGRLLERWVAAGATVRTGAMPFDPAPL